MESSLTIAIDNFGMPQMKTNVLSVGQIVRKQEHMVLTAESTYSISDQLFTILKLCQNVGKCKNWLYVVTANIESADAQYKLAYRNIKISTALYTAIKNLSTGSGTEKAQVKEPVKVTQ